MTKNFQKALFQENLYGERSFFKVFSHEFANFEIESEISEWLQNSEILDSRCFFRLFNFCTKLHKYVISEFQKYYLFIDHF